MSGEESLTDFWVRAANLLILPCSIAVIPPVAVVGLLAFGGWDLPGRSDPWRDVYGFGWAVAAVILAIIHSVLAVQNFRDPSIKRTAIAVVGSFAITLACPVFWFD